MIGWLFAALGLFVVQTLLPAALRYLCGGRGLRGRLAIALGPRDEQPPLSITGARAQRALVNLQEALPVFAPIALLHVAADTHSFDASVGAGVFVVARIAYVPAYLSGLVGFRSLCWVASWVGLALMIATFAR